MIQVVAEAGKILLSAIVNMKKRVNSWKSFFDDFNLVWGMKGLKVSFIVLLIFIIVLIVFLSILVKNFSWIQEIILRIPKGSDYLIIFAGFLLFVAVPFLIGIRIGAGLKKR